MKTLNTLLKENPDPYSMFEPEEVPMSEPASPTGARVPNISKLIYNRKLIDRQLSSWKIFRNNITSAYPPGMNPGVGVGVGHIPQKSPTMSKEEYDRNAYYMTRCVRAAKEIQSTLMQGQKVVFTGFRDAALKQLISTCGGEVVTAVSGKTTMVVADDLYSRSEKIQRAQEVGAFVISKAKLVQLLTVQ